MTSEMSAAERLLYIFGRPFARCFYRVTPPGLEQLPAGGFLLVPNHISWVDALILQLVPPADSLRHRLGILSEANLESVSARDWCIPISKRHSNAGVRAAAEKIAKVKLSVCSRKGNWNERGRYCD